MSANMFRSPRSTDAPMDFQFTSRPSTTPAWKAVDDNPSTPRKRPHDDLTPFTPTNASPFGFGANRNIPFIFATPSRRPNEPYSWAPPQDFSPATAFPPPSMQGEPKDIDMTEVSPPKPEEPKQDSDRAVATGALRRVYKARHKARGSRLALSRTREPVADNEVDSGDESEDGTRELTPITQNTSNHYTLNIPTPPGPQSDTPYILLGYLQFFFNLSLILVFLYLVLQFILTVQRDVEHRISEYSMDIVQEIARCSLEYRNNHCDTPLPGLKDACSDWEFCMNRDPTRVGRARVGAELIAEVVNGFVEPISWKTLAFTLTSLSFLTVFINALLSLYRSRHRPVAEGPPAHTPQFPIVHDTPYPPHHFGGYLSPAPTPNWGRTWRNDDEVDQTPTRRRRIEGGMSVKIK